AAIGTAHATATTAPMMIFIGRSLPLFSAVGRVFRGRPWSMGFSAAQGLDQAPFGLRPVAGAGKSCGKAGIEAGSGFVEQVGIPLLHALPLVRTLEGTPGLDGDDFGLPLRSRVAEGIDDLDVLPRGHLHPVHWQGAAIEDEIKFVDILLETVPEP